MIGAITAFMPLILISINLQVSAIEDAATFSEGVTGSGMKAKSVAINLLTQGENMDTYYTQQEFENRFENCGRGLDGINTGNTLQIKTSENSCTLNDPRNGTLKLGVQVEDDSEKILLGY
jgi:hypothetical protein